MNEVSDKEAQLAPVNTILCNDFDNDGLTDLLLAGNEYQTDVMKEDTTPLTAAF